MKIVKVLQKKDGSTLAIALLLAFVAQSAIMPVADYLTRFITRTERFNEYNPSFKDGFLLPLATFLVAILLIEIWLWIAAAAKTLPVKTTKHS